MPFHTGACVHRHISNIETSYVSNYNLFSPRKTVSNAFDTIILNHSINAQMVATREDDFFTRQKINNFNSISFL